MTPQSVSLVPFALAGLVLGGASFAILRLNTSLYVAGNLWGSLALHVGRLFLVAGALYGAARLGTGPLLASATGLVAARWLAVRLWGRLA